MGVAVIFAALSYRYIENPLRKCSSLTRRQKINLVLITLLAPLVMAIGVKQLADRYWTVEYSNGKLTNFQGDIGHIEFHAYSQENFFTCTPDSMLKIALTTEGFVRCQQSLNGKPVDIAIVGDSHAEHLFLGLAEALPKTNFAYYIQGKLPTYSASSEMSKILHYVENDQNIDVVIVTAFWGPSGVPTAELSSTFERLTASGKTVYVTDDIPHFPFDPVQCKYRISPLDQRNKCTIPVKTNDDFLKTYNKDLDFAVQRVPNVYLLETNKYFCDFQTCSMTSGEKILYRDTHHLNIYGSKFLATKLLEEYPDFLRALMSD